MRETNQTLSCRCLALCLVRKCRWHRHRTAIQDNKTARTQHYICARARAYRQQVKACLIVSFWEFNKVISGIGEDKAQDKYKTELPPVLSPRFHVEVTRA